VKGNKEVEAQFSIIKQRKRGETKIKKDDQEKRKQTWQKRAEKLFRANNLE
jgi:hypothetical protein